MNCTKMNNLRSFLKAFVSTLVLFAILSAPKVYPYPGISHRNNLKSPDSRSFYTEPLVDKKAIYLTPENFPVTPDKDGDDSDALQQAINKAAAQSGFGIVMIPEGEYQITKTIYVWSGIRLIGTGAKRPVFILVKKSEGFQGPASKYIIHFASRKPAEGQTVRDANPGTFYSALSNIDFIIEDGNPSAVAVRSHYAQHCYIAHVDFYIGKGRAGVEEVGNEMEDCRFYGGEYGILTKKPSPSWPFLLLDSYFEGQTKTAISTEEGGLTLVRNMFKDTPSAIVVNQDRAEELFITDSRFENISGPALVISDENNARSQYNLKNIVCVNTPFLVSFRESNKQIKIEHKIYLVKDFCHGNQITDLGCKPEINTTKDILQLNKIPDLVESDISKLPPCENWINILTFGAKGDGKTDDTEIIKKAIAQYDAIYFPTGRYMVSQSIELKPNTVLIGLNPIATQIVLSDKTPGFCGKGSPVALLQTPQNGKNIVTGIGLDGGAYNERVVVAKWMAGPNSLMNDVKFIGGHGTMNADGSAVQTYNQFRNSDPFLDRDWDSQYWSLWITNGGGGTFKDIWSANSFAQAGIYISNTSTEGRLYATSIEHHVRNEVIFRGVSNWKIFDMQMEEESAEGPQCLPLRIEDCCNLTFANLYLYRVIRIVSPFANAVILNNSKNIQFCGMHVYSPSKFSYDNTLYEQSFNYQVREREIARLTVSGKPPKENLRVTNSSVALSRIKVEKIASGFEFADGAAADSKGNILFTDSRWKKIYKWSPDTKMLSLVREMLFTPTALVIDKDDNLLITTADGQVVAFNPENSGNDMMVIKPIAPQSHNGKIAVLPGHRWRDEHDFLTITTYSKEKPPVTTSSYTAYQRGGSNPLTEHFLAPDGVTFIPQCQDLRRAFSLRKAVPGNPFFMADEFGQKTYKFFVNEDGSLSNPKLFAEKGELDVAVDVNGNVYIPAGNIFVYDPSGKLIEEIEIPERPTNVVFGGKDFNTLYVTARSSLYKIEINTK